MHFVTRLSFSDVQNLNIGKKCYLLFNYIFKNLELIKYIILTYKRARYYNSYIIQ